MNLPCAARNAIFICTAVLLSLSFASWKAGDPDTARPVQDTVPTRQEKKAVDLDKAMQELDNAQEDLKKTMREIDWDKVNTEVKEAMKDLHTDLQKVNAEMKKSLQKIDVEKLRRDVNESVAKIDWDKMKKDLEHVKTVDLEKVKAELEDVKVELQNLKPELEKNLNEAHQNIEKSKTELQEYKSFIADLERDGLINKNEPYKVEHNEGQLLLNGKAQSQEVYNRYRTFLEKHKTFTLQKNEGDFKLDTE